MLDDDGNLIIPASAKLRPGDLILIKEPGSWEIVAEGNTYTIPDGPKMLKETLCVAASRIANSPDDEGRKRHHIDRLSRLIAECDRKRPVGPDGKHDDRHTAECGCVDR